MWWWWQVVGPAAAGAWLASTAAFMQHQYQFIHCAQFDLVHCPARAWLLSSLGTRLLHPPICSCLSYSCGTVKFNYAPTWLPQKKGIAQGL